MSTENEVTEEQIDAAIIHCLRIFAARGRQLRLQRERERLANTQTGQATTDSRNIRTEPDSPSATSSAHDIQDKNTMIANDQTTASDVPLEKSECSR